MDGYDVGFFVGSSLFFCQNKRGLELLAQWMYATGGTLQMEEEMSATGLTTT